MAKSIKNLAKQFDERLSQMKGQTFNYGGNIHHLSDYSIDEGAEKVTIKTNLNTFTRFFDSVDSFLDYWVPVTKVNAVSQINNEQEANIALQKENALADQMISILQDNIKKVQDNPGYIEQAKAINNNVNSVINIVKLKMAFVKESKRKRS